MEKTEKKLMHYMSRAISDYAMLQDGDRVLVCLSGGKDSFTMLHLLHKIRRRTRINFELFAFTLDQSQPGWDDSAMRAWLERHDYPYAIVKKDTYSVVLDKVKEGKTYCSLCSRLRRGNIYGYAERNNFNKIALGHHRDDLIESMLMSILYNGIVRSMPPKLLNDDKKHIVVRPLVYCQEADIKTYSEAQQFPIIPCNLCGSQENLTRQRIKQLIADLAAQNPKVPSNILGAIGNIQPSQLMDDSLWDFRNLEDGLIALSEEIPRSETS
ncbi:MAG: tRNA 2-thiocytidine(32) synthetase TtcA [Gammaproteobacteria bacterium]|nr:MAG: tRNA 2-thiocytidine(32) synthetase TtcA [Gammaproteobacteria bacterium]